MKFYTYGNKINPVILLIPGTCCHHSIFDEVVPKLSLCFYTVVVSFSGFDETESSVYLDMDTETLSIEEYVKKNFGSTICCSYGALLVVLLFPILSKGKTSI